MRAMTLGEDYIITESIEDLRSLITRTFNTTPYIQHGVRAALGTFQKQSKSIRSELQEKLYLEEKNDKIVRLNRT